MRISTFPLDDFAQQRSELGFRKRLEEGLQENLSSDTHQRCLDWITGDFSGRQKHPSDRHVDQWVSARGVCPVHNNRTLVRENDVQGMEIHMEQAPARSAGCR